MGNTINFLSKNLHENGFLVPKRRKMLLSLTTYSGRCDVICKPAIGLQQLKILLALLINNKSWLAFTVRKKLSLQFVLQFLAPNFWSCNETSICHLKSLRITTKFLSYPTIFQLNAWLILTSSYLYASMVCSGNVPELPRCAMFKGLFMMGVLANDVEVKQKTSVTNNLAGFFIIFPRSVYNRWSVSCFLLHQKSGYKPGKLWLSQTMLKPLRTWSNQLWSEDSTQTR